MSQYAFGYLNKGYTTILRTVTTEQLGKTAVWDPIIRRRNPVSSILVQGYVMRTTGKSRRLGIVINQALPTLFVTLSTGTTNPSYAPVRTIRDNTGNAFGHDEGHDMVLRICHTVSRYFNQSCTLGMQVTQLPSEGHILQSSHREDSFEARGVRLDLTCPDICAARAMSAYVLAAIAAGKNLFGGYLSPAITTQGQRVNAAFTGRNTCKLTRG